MSRDRISVQEATEIAEHYLQVPLHRFLNPSLKSLSASEAEIILTTTESLLTPTSALHAGAVYAGLELANVLAVLPHLNHSEYAASIDHSVSLIGNITGVDKQVLIRSRMLRRGGNVAFFESEAYDASNMALLAKGKTTKTIRKIPDKKSHPVEVRESKL
ncbi:hypothetical protein P389DRAFT_95626 [Cystobasidium minutum MCA 4210]|uniref:uncharacterized protein n=1 Tax=Cystobasidium minutum MCA 4210 TaxID=1397322 RepID=UPI0034CF0E9A|eukprot:jgi/Rhomi1/95626/CE95625_167